MNVKDNAYLYDLEFLCYFCGYSYIYYVLVVLKNHENVLPIDDTMTSSSTSVSFGDVIFALIHL
jgi:hypothetical protein